MSQMFRGTLKRGLCSASLAASNTAIFARIVAGKVNGSGSWPALCTKR